MSYKNLLKSCRKGLCLCIALCLLLGGTAAGSADTLPDVIPIPTSPPFSPEAFPLKDYVRELISREAQRGGWPVNDLPVEEIFSLIGLMETHNRPLDSQTLKAYQSADSDEKRKERALDILYQYSPIKLGKKFVSIGDIINTELGSIYTRPLGMKAWISQVEAEFQGELPIARHVMPGAEDISEADAIRCAYEVMIEIYGLAYQEILAMEQYHHFLNGQYVITPSRELLPFMTVPREGYAKVNTWLFVFQNAKYTYVLDLSHEGTYLNAEKWER